ncbi:MAG: hypothetical protein HYY51_02395 [Candidatus Magasanikbacteria bacterium]|nr:hypothetical protein [Candidatus Magasanikbacteria bacterium]
MYLAAKLERYRLALAIIATAFFALMLAPAAFAGTGDIGANCTATSDCKTGLVCASTGKCAAAPTGSDIYGLGKVNTELKTTLGNQDLRTTIAKLINVALSLLGIVAVVIILVGGFKWMTAGGNEDKVAEARKLIFSGIIGLAIILSAWAIALFVLNKLASATTGTNTGIPTELQID